MWADVSAVAGIRRLPLIGTSSRKGTSPSCPQEDAWPGQCTEGRQGAPQRWCP